MTIGVMLHVNKDGYMSMLEIVRHDGGEITNPPTAEHLLVLMPESGGIKPS